MPLQATSGAASYDAFGGGTVAKVNYIEDFFQSYLRTGTGASATVTTGLDGSTKETLVWTKSRSAATNHKLTDNVRGATKALSSNTTSAEATDSQGLTAFSATGYTIGTNTDYNNSGATYVDWQWVSQPKFFDVVTWTGSNATGSGVQNIAHNLGSTPAVIIVKCIDQPDYNWIVYHRSLGATKYVYLNTTGASGTTTNFWNDTEPTSTQFTVGVSGSVNGQGQQYVAYLFAHDAGGFGLTGTDNVISCGSYTGNGSYPNGPVIDVGFEPQWVMVKRATGGTGQWLMLDTMRGWTANLGNQQGLWANTSAAEAQNASGLELQTRGWQLRDTDPEINGNGSTYIYIAIRRGPMKVPTDATKVFKPVARSGTGSTATITAGFPVDLEISKTKTNPGPYGWFDRLRGATLWLTSSGTDAEATASDSLTSFASNTGVIAGADTTGLINYGSDTYANWMFQRAPSFFDEVCYTGTGVAGRTVAHNLTVAPELMIVKSRSGATNWIVYSNASGNTKFLQLNTTIAESTGATIWNNTTPTSSVFSLGTATTVNINNGTFVAYLFATCAGVSKVGSYTGTGTTLQVNCGFTAGARFVLIKRTNSTGDWYVWDSARGIVAGNDPYLLLNTTGVDVTNTDYVDTYSAGFEISSTAPAAINASGGTFIFLAIA